MVRKLESDSRELQELLMALTKFIEVMQVSLHIIVRSECTVILLQTHQDGVRSEFSELLKQFKELKFPTAPPKFLIPFNPNSNTT